MTQEYTPVAWQDETTSQQGTLINAERLNQMQTAHHYADGLEEVDAIPTADPGVGYHKIVYCTADNTIYRWDGTEWTADIDDETKALLLEHEADHDNPHQVTKAQVGLGNCDNTSDLNKPISTAAQTALNAKADKATTYTKTETDTLLAEKADKATTLAGYGITDAYTKSQADSLLADKADKADTYDKTAVDGLLGGKVDKLISSPAGTYKSVTVNAQGQVTAGTNPTTLAGYGIADAYSKTETDTLLATKADVATTYTKAEVDTALALKANNNAVVHLAGAETIPGAKTFTEVVSFNRTIGLIRHDFSGIEYGVTAGTWNSEIYRDKNNVEIGRQALVVDANKTSWKLRAKNGDSTMEMGLDSNASGPYVYAPTPGAGAPEAAVPTINWVSQTGDSAPNNLVHRTGDETKSGFFTMRRANLKGVIIGADNTGYVRAYVGDNATTSGELAMIAFMSGKGYNANDINNWAIMIFNSRPTTPINRIVPVAQGTFQQAGAYAMTFDSQGRPEIWVKITVAGITNHRIMSQILMQTSATNISSDYFQEGDNAYYSEADFATNYPDAVYSS